MSRITTVLLDLDDTLVVEMDAERVSLLMACGLARDRYDVDAVDLLEAIFTRAEEFWSQGEDHGYCDRIGSASFEALWATFEGKGPELARLRQWAPRFRRAAWLRALDDVGVHDDLLADELSERYQRERRKRFTPFDETEETLQDLRRDYRLGMLTNGLVDVQQAKIDGSGLAHYFEEIFITGSLGLGKPDPRAFGVILERMGSAAEETVMVGNSMSGDIKGAMDSGLRSVWMNVEDEWAEEDITPDAEIADLTQLRPALERLAQV